MCVVPLKPSNGGLTLNEVAGKKFTAKLALTCHLAPGTYSIVETPQDGWTSDGGSSECNFTVNLPADGDRTVAMSLSRADREHTLTSRS